MKRYLVVVATVAALAAAACSSAEARAATVNGTDLTTADVEALMFAPGDDLGGVEFTQLLDILVQWTAIAEAASADFGVEPTADEIATEVDQIYSVQGAGLTFEEFLERENISESGLGLYAEQLLIGEGILAELEASVGQPTDDQAAALLDEDPGAWTEVCAAHILVATEEEAGAVVERLGAGEDFAALAIELSLDTGSGAAGGDLGCRAPSGPSPYVPEFAAATMTGELGEITGPVETQFGFHLIRVDSRTPPSIEELKSAVADSQLSEAVNEWYVGALTAADIEVAAEWGTWTTDPTPGIQPAPELVP